MKSDTPNHRKCGSCRECCILLEVEPMEKPANKPCQHLCGSGCGIYETRPQVCRVFKCAWLEGSMGNRDQPNRTHMVTWVTNMASMEGKKMDVVQCDIREGTKRHRKTMRWLIGVSYLMPVNIVQGQACELWAYGRKIIEWDQDDFVHLEYDKGGRIIGGRVVPRAHVLQGDEDTEKWADTVARGIQVEEIDPVYREAQLRYMKTVADERSKK